MTKVHKLLGQPSYLYMFNLSRLILFFITQNDIGQRTYEHSDSQIHGGKSICLVFNRLGTAKIDLIDIL